MAGQDQPPPLGMMFLSSRVRPPQHPSGTWRCGSFLRQEVHGIFPGKLRPKVHRIGPGLAEVDHRRAPRRVPLRAGDLSTGE